MEHQPNAQIVAFLRARAIRRSDGNYQEHTHPDLVELLYKSGEALGATGEYFFGFPTLVSPNGVIFAYAQGTTVIVFRPPPGGFERDLPPGIDGIDVVPGWIPTDAWLGSRIDWTVREGDAAIDERFITAAIAASQLPTAGRTQN